MKVPASISCLLICILLGGPVYGKEIGVEHIIVYESQVPVTVKKIEDKSPVWLRIISVDFNEEKYSLKISCIGNVSGKINIADFLEPADNTADADLEPLVITFHPKLPDNHLIGVHQDDLVQVPRFGFTTLILIVLGVLWIGFPCWFLVRKIIVFCNRPGPVTPKEVLPLERILPILSRARDQKLSISEIALLEHLLNVHLSSETLTARSDIKRLRKELENCLYMRDCYDQSVAIEIIRKLSGCQETATGVEQ